MLGARAVRVNQDRKGRLRPLGDDAGDDLRGLVASIAATTSALRDRPRRRRFTLAESQQLMQSQDREEFIATSACPGCGEIAAHALRSPAPGEPSWAEVIRRCAVCGREWAQR
jgi:hypothetical protein